MRTFISFSFLCVFFGFLQVSGFPADVKKVEIIGEIANHTLIGTKNAFVATDPYSRGGIGFTFPRAGSDRGYIITGYKQIDLGLSPKVRIEEGGIGSNYITISATATDLGNEVLTVFEFYGDKTNLAN